MVNAHYKSDENNINTQFILLEPFVIFITCLEFVRIVVSYRGSSAKR